MLRNKSYNFNLKEIWARLFFVLFCLFLYRVCVSVSLPGASYFFDGNKGRGFFSFIGLFSGGAVEKMSVMALGIMPYISASIVFQLLIAIIPSLEKVSKDGDVGRVKINRYTRLLAVFVAFVQAYAFVYSFGRDLFFLNVFDVILFYVVSVSIIVAGSMFVLWIGETITERGVGNGISLIVFFGIVSRVPEMFTFVFFNSSFGICVMLFLFLFVFLFFIVFLERSYRKISVQYVRKVLRDKLSLPVGSYIPLKINSAGVIPPIFASSVLAFPALFFGVFGFGGTQSFFLAYFSQGWLHFFLYLVLIVFFSYFYVSLSLGVSPVAIAEGIHKQGGFIPGIRPGKATSELLDNVLNKITFIGAVYLVFVCIVPEIFASNFFSSFQGVFFGGTSMLILVGVSIDTITQLNSLLVSVNYNSFFERKKNKFNTRGLN